VRPYRGPKGLRSDPWHNLGGPLYGPWDGLEEVAHHRPLRNVEPLQGSHFTMQSLFQSLNHPHLILTYHSLNP